VATPDTIWSKGELVGGTYRIESLIGIGGMGHVYEAFDTVLFRRVAVKALLPKFDPAFLIQEARSLAQFNHSTVVAVHALGVHDGIHYMVMERLRGVSLYRHLARRSGADRLLLPEVLDIAIGLVDGLTLIHREGLIHRDLKPANIMLALGHRVVLMDFGLVVTVQEAMEDPQFCGTPQYIAPEIIAPPPKPVDRRLSDLYAFGVMLFEMLAGRHPFNVTGDDKMLAAHQHSPVPRVSSFRPNVPAALDELVAALMAKSPDERPQSADTVAWTLRQIRDQGAVTSDTGMSVLIVDDEVEAALLVERYVRQALPSAALQLAHTGEAALTAARAKPPDLILLDLALPDLNGSELAMLLRASPVFDNSRIAVLSGRATDEDRDLLRKLGINDFIPKGPETRRHILDLIRNMLRGNPRRSWSGAALLPTIDGKPTPKLTY
jgi:serine/threonine-protein kinase